MVWVMCAIGMHFGVGLQITHHEHGVVLLWVFSGAIGVLVFMLIVGRFKRRIVRTSKMRGVGSSLMLISIGLSAMGWSVIRTHPGIGGSELDMIVSRSVGEDWVQSRKGVPIEVQGVLVERVVVEQIEYGPGVPPMWSDQRVGACMRIERVYGRDREARMSWVECDGDLRVSFDIEGWKNAKDDHHLGVGDRVGLSGIYRPPGKQRNLGELDWARLSEQSNRVGSIVGVDYGSVQRIEGGGFLDQVSRAWIGFRDRIRDRAINALSANQDHDEGNAKRASLMSALLLGQREQGFDEIYKGFQRVGVAHVLAISGFHLALMVMLGAMCIRFFGDFPRLELVYVLVVLGFGMLVIPLRPPVVRAGLIVCSILLSDACGRRYDRMCILSWVGIGLLVWRPMDVHNLGYQLSMGISAFLVMMSIGSQAQEQGVDSMKPTSGFSLWWMRISEDQRYGMFIEISAAGMRKMIDGFLMNVKCWLIACPLIIAHVGGVSVLAPIVAMVLIPMVVLLMVLGYIQVLIGMVHPGMGEVVGRVASPIGDGVIGLVEFVDHLGWSWVQIPGVVGEWGWVWGIGMISAIWMMMVHRSHRGIRRVGSVLCALCVVSGGVLILGGGFGRAMSPLRIDMLDVGDGTCMIVESEGEAMIWDCGSLDRRVGMSAWNATRSLGVNQVRFAIVTHDNIDHFNGLITLARESGLERVMVSPMMMDDPSFAWRETQVELESYGIEIQVIERGDVFEFGRVSMRVLWPSGIDGDDRAYKSNDRSLVMLITMDISEGEESKRVLLCGDIEERAMDEIFELEPDLVVDVMEMPHHGSVIPSAGAFVEQLDPQIVLQSTGIRRVNDPRFDSIRINREWYASGDRGGAWVEIDDEGTITHGWSVD